MVVVPLLAAVALALAFLGSPAPAQALDDWTHDGANTCQSCHKGTAPTDAVCTECHLNFESYPDKTCWSCHAPGQETETLSAPSSACSQECHLYYKPLKSYVTPFTHGLEPHAGATGFGFECLDCHNTSSLSSVNGSPHHIGQTTPAPTCEDCHDGSLPGVPDQPTHDGVACTSCHEGMNIPPVPSTCQRCHASSTFGSGNCASCHSGAIHDTTPNVGSCASCHSGYQKHAGEQSCAGCHTNEAKVHHVNVKITTKSCRSCHAKGHAGVKVANSRCASCHKGTGSGPAARVVHSANVTRQRVCGACHSKALHARSRSGITSCRTCHKAKFHARQPRPGNSVCLTCHSRARFHSVGFACYVCHRPALHDATPNVLPVRSGA
jgi:hypothetical protein